jgi:DNA-binding transcriptional ArsR family regulator
MTLETRTLTEAKALSALANPFRSRIMDALRVDGPSTTSALAARTGQAVGSTSHHVKVLAEAELVEEAPELAKDRRERWWRLTSRSTRWSHADFADDPAAVTAAMAAESLQTARQFERLRAWQDNADTSGDWLDASFSTQSWLRMTPDELIQLSTELVDLLTGWSRRDIPDDGQEREPVLFFAHGFPAQP